MNPLQSRLRLPEPRLLPITIGVMAMLLVVKSSHMVFAATGESAPPGHAGPAPPAAKAEPPPSPTEPGKTSKVETNAPAPPAAAPAATAPMAPAEPAISESERALLTDLRDRRKALDAREAALATRETTLTAVEKRLSVRLDELTALQTRLEGLERQRREHDEGNWRGLVKLYETMKPRDAATIFNDLEFPVLLPVLDRMKEVKAAAILAAMLPERARQATAELAQMRAKANSIEPTPVAVPTAAARKG